MSVVFKPWKFKSTTLGLTDLSVGVIHNYSVHLFPITNCHVALINVWRYWKKYYININKHSVVSGIFLKYHMATVPLSDLCTDSMSFPCILTFCFHAVDGFEVLVHQIPRAMKPHNHFNKSRRHAVWDCQLSRIFMSGFFFFEKQWQPQGKGVES